MNNVLFVNATIVFFGNIFIVIFTLFVQYKIENLFSIKECFFPEFSLTLGHY